jgi:hypothetical protein
MVIVAGSAVVVSQASADQKTLDLKKWYVLVNRNSGKVLDDRGSAKNDGAAVVQWARHGGANQQWRFIDAGHGYYRLKNRTSGKVLDDLGWSKTAGSAIVHERRSHLFDGGAFRQLRRAGDLSGRRVSASG